MSEDTLIIETRLGALSKNLEDVQQLMESVQRSRDLERRLLATLYDEDESVDICVSRLQHELVSAHNRLRPVIRQLKNNNDLKAVGEMLETAEQVVLALRKHVDDADAILDELDQRRVKFEEDRLEEEVNEIFEQNAATTISSVDDARDALSGVAEASDGDADEGDSGEASGAVGNAVHGAWRKYAEIVEAEPGNDLFGEYVDFLGGLALRETASDTARICQLADELIARWEYMNIRARHTLTVPARSEARHATLARIIRLGFPEWTIWALPLAAHEFGHVVVEVNRLAGESSDPFVAHYLADCFGTYALGPAYACAAILLRLNPLRAGQDSAGGPSDAKRARVVLATLELMGEQDETLTQYTQLADRLGTSWTTAMAQADVALRQPDESEAVDEPVPEEGAVADRAAAAETHDGERSLDESVKCMWTFLRGSAGGVLYREERAERVAEWKELLAQPGGHAGIQLHANDQLADVLNGAWIARIAKPDKTDVILDEAEELIAQLRAHKPRTGGSTESRVGDRGTR